MNDIERQDRIDRYVRNEMTEREKADFEHEMLVDEELKKEVQLDMMIADSIKKQAAKRELMKEWDKDYKEDLNIGLAGSVCYSGMTSEEDSAVAGQASFKPAKRKNHFWLITSTVGVAVCLAVGVCFTLFDSKNQYCETAPSGDVQFSKEYTKSVDEPDFNEEDYAATESPNEYSIDESIVDGTIYDRNLESAVDSATEMINAGEYSDVLNLTDDYFDRKSLESGDFMDLLDNDRQYELLWLRIKALDGLGRTDEALLILKYYVKKDGKHQKEADDMLKSLAKKNIQQNMTPQDLKKTLDK